MFKPKAWVKVYRLSSNPKQILNDLRTEGDALNAKYTQLLLHVAEDLNSGLPRTNPLAVRAGLELGASGFQD